MMTMIIRGVVVFILLITLINPQPTSATTQEEKLAQIAQLQALVKQLTELLTVQQFRKDNKNVEESGCLYITKYLYIGKDDEVTGGDVSRLQAYLAKDNSIYPEGLVTGYYGEASTRAVRRFQERYNVVGKNDDEYGRVLEKTISYLKQNCKPQEKKTTFSNSEPIPTLIAPNEGVFDYRENMIVIAHVYNVSSYGGIVSVSATGGNFGNSRLINLGEVEVDPGFSGQVQIPISRLNMNRFKLGEEYTLIVEASDKFYGQHTPNIDYSDGIIKFSGTKNTLTFEEANPCYTENYPCWSSVKPEYKPSVKVVNTSVRTVNGGTQGVFTAVIDIEATNAGDIYISDTKGLALSVRRATGTTVSRVDSVAERSIVDSYNSKKLISNGETFYRIEAGERAKLTTQLLYEPEYEGNYNASVTMVSYKVDLEGTDFVFRPKINLTPTDDLYISGPAYDYSIEKFGVIR